MYAYIKGIITHISSVFAVLETGGIGYQIYIPANAISRLPPKGSEALLYTSFIVREQSQQLFGFVTEGEKELFEVLLNVSGIGPKTAISLIGHMSYHEFVDAVKNEDIKKICRVPGIGKKTAERLFLEIRDKLPALYGIDPSHFQVKKGSPDEIIIQDAISGLINLGYNQNMASKAVQKVMETHQGIGLAELITLSLKGI